MIEEEELERILEGFRIEEGEHLENPVIKDHYLNVLFSDNRVRAQRGNYWITFHDAEGVDPETYFDSGKGKEADPDADFYVEVGASGKRREDPYRAALDVLSAYEHNVEEVLEEAVSRVDSFDVSTPDPSWTGT